MELSSVQKAVLNIITVTVWALGILVILFVLSKGKELKQETGVSLKTYLAIVGLAEIFYVIGALMILSTMGLNVMRHLAEFEIWKLSQAVERLDMGTVQVIGAVGWGGFAINRSISFLAPGYLLVYGGRRLPGYIYLSVWAEIGLETLTSALIAVSLVAG